MNRITIAALAAACALVAGCGGGGGDDTGPPTTQPTSYPMVKPTVGATSVYTVTSVDDLNTTVVTSYRNQVASVAADGSYAIDRDDPSNSGAAVNGIDYHTYPTVYAFSATGRETSIASASTGTGCTVAALDAGHAVPWTIGQTFTETDGMTCTQNTDYTLAFTGSVSALESVTVPAGTFNALRMDIAETSATPDGEHVATTITLWVDPQHSFFTIKEVDVTTMTPAPARHYVVTRTTELQSRTN